MKVKISLYCFVIFIQCTGVFTPDAGLEFSNYTIYVSPTGNNNNSGFTSNKPIRTITKALELVNERIDSVYTIILTDGIYSRKTNQEIFPITLKSNVHIKGASQNTIVQSDGGKNIFYSELKMNVILENMTITDGDKAIYTMGGNIELINLVIKNNKVGYIGESQVNIKSCIFRNNDEAIVSFPRVGQNFIFQTIIYNNITGIECIGHSDQKDINLRIKNVLMVQNESAIFSNDTYPVLENVTIADNQSGFGWARDENGYISQGINCIFWNHKIDISPHPYHKVEYSCIKGGFAGEGNISGPPQFISPEDMNYRLEGSSVCINSGHPGISYKDFDGTRNDMGAYGGMFGNW